MDIGNTINLLCKQSMLMTEKFSETSLPWLSRSKWIGYSSVLYFLPPYILKVTTAPTAVFYLALLLQPIVSFYSDYLWSGRRHISHGLDRWLSTSLIIIMIIISSCHLGLYTIIPATPPIYFLHQGKCAIKQRNYPAYVFNHTLWHFVSPISGSIVLWIIQRKNDNVFSF